MSHQASRWLLQRSMNILYRRVTRGYQAKHPQFKSGLHSSVVSLHGSAVSLKPLVASLQGCRQASKALGNPPRLQASLNDSRKAFSASGCDFRTTLKHQQLQAENPKLRTRAPRLHGVHSRLQDGPVIIQGENSRF
jgi:hypothetical protein